jgi:hypothetical protein
MQASSGKGYFGKTDYFEQRDVQNEGRFVDVRFIPLCTAKILKKGVL